jgi:hypothetical protein
MLKNEVSSNSESFDKKSARLFYLIAAGMCVIAVAMYLCLFI